MEASAVHAGVEYIDGFGRAGVPNVLYLGESRFEETTAMVAATLRFQKFMVGIIDEMVHIRCPLLVTGTRRLLYDGNSVDLLGATESASDGSDGPYFLTP